MAINAGLGLTPADAYKGIIAQAVATKAHLTAERARLVTPTVSSVLCVGVIQHFWAVIPRLTQFAAVPGVAAYAKAQKDDPAFDVQAEWTTLRNAMISCRDNLISMFPVNAQGFALYQTLTATGFTHRDFTDAQVAPALPLIDAVIAAC